MCCTRGMARDWRAWHAHYEDPTSALSRRLEVVRRELATLLTKAPGDDLSLVSMCAGDGRDTLPVLATSAPGTRAVLVELDDELADAARRTATSLGLERVEVRTADAGTTDSYADGVPADVLLACGVFGNVSDADVARTVAALPMLLADRATVIWTRGCRVDHDPTELAGDPSEHIRELFAAAGFEEVSFVRPEDAGFRVGVHRLVVPPQRWQPGGRMFDFV